MSDFKNFILENAKTELKESFSDSLTVKEVIDILKEYDGGSFVVVYDGHRAREINTIEVFPQSQSKKEIVLIQI